VSSETVEIHSGQFLQGLIQDEEPGFRVQMTNDIDEDPLRQGKVRHDGSCGDGDLHGFEDTLRIGKDLPGIKEEPGESMGPVGKEVIGYRLVAEKFIVLGYQFYSHALGCVDIIKLPNPTVPENIPRLRLYQSPQDPGNGGLSRPVFPHNSVKFPRGDADRYVIQDQQIPIGNPNTL
jgi:hypothetical protein